MINARGFTTYAAADAWGTWLAMLYLKNWRDSEGDEQDAEDRKCSSYDQLCEVRGVEERSEEQGNTIFEVAISYAASFSGDTAQQPSLTSSHRSSARRRRLERFRMGIL